MRAATIALMLMAAAPGPGLEVGDKLQLYAGPDRGIPILEGEQDYRDFLAAIRAGRFPNPPLREVVMPGRLVEVVTLDPGPFAVNAPAAEIRIAEGPHEGELYWVAQQHIRPRDVADPEGEYRLPDFRLVRLRGFPFRPGELCNLVADDRPEIPCGADRGAFERIKAALAGPGQDGGRIEGPGVVQSRPYERAEVVRRHSRAVGAVECRMLQGPDRGKTLWVPARFVVRFEVRVDRIRDPSRRR